MMGGTPVSIGLRLRPLRFDDREAFLAAHDVMAEEKFIFGFGFEPEMPWSAYLQILEDRRMGINLPADFVPATYLVADVAGEIIGRVSIRYVLNRRLSREGGHIGYGVLPQHRRRGHATEILRQSLGIARANAVDRALLTCGEDNIGSIAVIEKCGGRLDSVICSVPGAIPTRRYWVDSALSTEQYVGQ
jgi:predicted acetyltransferase